MAPSRIRVRMWRLLRPEKGPGLLLWFDPECEAIELRELSKSERVDGLRERDEPVWTDPAQKAEGPPQLHLFDGG